MRHLFALALTVCVVAPEPPAKWHLVEEWRVGGNVDGPYSLTDIRGMAILPNGHIVILDHQDQQLHFLDARGRLLRTVGRKGEGPGEFQGANGLVLTPDGRVIVNDPDNNRLTVLSLTGDLLESVPITNPWGFSYTWDAWVDRSGRVNEYVPVRRGNERVAGRRLWSADLATVDTVYPVTCPAVVQPTSADFSYSFQSSRGGMTMGIPHATPRRTGVSAPDGSSWRSAWPEFNSIRHVPAGQCEPDVTVALREARVPIPTAVRDSAVELVKTNAAKYGAPIPDLSKIPRSYQPFDALFLDSGSRLWVERRSDATHKRFDVFSPAGVLLAQADEPPLLQPYRPFIITNDRMLGFVADGDGVQYLVVWKIGR